MDKYYPGGKGYETAGFFWWQGAKDCGNVSTVYSKPFCHGGSANSHYGGNAKTYMDVGLAMGEAMVELLKNGK